MKKTIPFLTAIIIALAGIAPGMAFFEDNVEEIIAQANSDTVEGVSATAGNGLVFLIWNTKKNEDGEEATGYRVEYGPKSVEAGAAEEYASSKETDDTIPSIKIEDLTVDTEYFFTVIAIFSDDSETPPSDEVSATPLGDMEQAPDEAPIVISAEALSRSQVSVVFSEDITLPTSNAELAFAIELENDDSTIIDVLGAEYAADLDTGVKDQSEVILTTKDLSVEESYRVTVSAQIVDENDNPIESGSTDNAVFEGSDGDPIDLTPLLLLEEDTVEEHPAASIDSEVDLNQELAALLDGEKEEGVPQDELFPWDAEEEDTTPPEDISNLMASYVARLKDYLVTLTWNSSPDTAKDLDDQLFYRSTTGGKKWDPAQSLGKTTTKKQIAEQPETEITYRITTKDVAGNESVGIIRAVSLPALPATGPVSLVAAGIALAGSSLRFLRKKK